VITATAEDQPVLSIQGLCALLGVSRSWYYERLSQPEATPSEDLALSQTPHDDDLALLNAYQLSLEPTMRVAVMTVADILYDVVPYTRIVPTARMKQLRSTIAKMQRSSTALSRMQDIVGFRVVVPMVRDQNAVLDQLQNLDGWTIIDRRDNPSHGYRAVHAVYRDNRGIVEARIRTFLQHQWAEPSERYGHTHPEIKYGEGPASIRQRLASFSEMIAVTESIEDVDRNYPDTAQHIIEVRRSLLKALDTQLNTIPLEAEQ